jgi:hypothetical protein
MKRYVYISVAISLVLFGCTSQKSIQMKDVPVTTKLSDTFKSVTLNIAVGEVMIERFSLKVKPGFIATTDNKINIGVYSKNNTISIGIPNPFYNAKNEQNISSNNIYIKKDSKWTCNYQTTDNLLYICNEDTSQFNYYIYIDSSGIPKTVYNKANKIPYEILDTPAGLFKSIDIIQLGSFKQELIYNGKSKDTLRVSYREYVDDLARPSYFQDLTYDLSESKEIAFRDIKMDVLEATNTNIKFIIK